MNTRTVLIVGAGGVLGTVLAKEFTQHQNQVIGIRRSVNRTDDATADNHSPFQSVHYCDMQDHDALRKLADQIVSEQGQVDVLIYNAAHLVMRPFMELQYGDFEESWRAAVGGAVTCAQAVLPSMLNRGRGVMIFSGATSAMRGASRFAAFASAKFALRGLTQSLAREYQSQGIHVAHVVMDGLLSGSKSIACFGGREDNSIDPAAVAQNYRWLADQPPSAWTLELDLRPHSERF